MPSIELPTSHPQPSNPTVLEAVLASASQKHRFLYVSPERSKKPTPSMKPALLSCPTCAFQPWRSEELPKLQKASTELEKRKDDAEKAEHLGMTSKLSSKSRSKSVKKQPRNFPHPGHLREAASPKGREGGGQKGRMGRDGRAQQGWKETDRAEGMPALESAPLWPAQNDPWSKARPSTPSFWGTPRFQSF